MLQLRLKVFKECRCARAFRNCQSTQTITKRYGHYFNIDTFFRYQLLVICPEQQENVTDIEIPLKRKHSYPDQVRDTGDAFSECVSVSAPPSFGSVYSQASQTSPSTAKPQPGSVSREPHGAWISPPCSQSLQQQGTAAGQMANTISSLPSADAGPR